MLVQTVHDEKLVARVLVLHVVAQDGVGGALLYLVVAHRKQPVAFVGHNYVLVLVDKLHAAVAERDERAGEVDLDS